MKRFESGTVDQSVYFNAGQIGLTGFTVYRARNGATAAAMSTPTVTEVDSTNMPGVYALLLDEDMTIGAGNVTEQMVFYVTAAGMAAQYIEIELYVDTSANVSAIKAQTDKLLFDVANQLNANATYLNGTKLNGNGAGTPWGP